MKLRAFLAPTLVLVVAACAPEIGDECANSIDCSQQGDRLCDTTQPGGYCTIFNCEPDTCPDGEAVCVAFDYVLDPSCGSVNDTEWSRFERTFCMKACEDDSDCRDGYECVAPADMLIIDTDPVESHFCLRKAATPASPGGGQPSVCHPADAGTDLDAHTFDGGTGASGGSGGSGGAGGAGGSGGATGGGGSASGGGGSGGGSVGGGGSGGN